MGNDFNPTHSCTGVSHLCEQTYHKDSLEQIVTLNRKKIRSTEEIKQKIIKYIEANRLHLYSSREKKVFETLVSVDQEHVADKVIEMDKRVKSLEEQKKQLAKTQEKLAKENQNNEKQDQKGQTKKNQVETLGKKITELKEQRKKMFEEAECLLLQDLDMIFEQIPKFDKNYEKINTIVSMTKSQAQAEQNPKPFFQNNGSGLNNGQELMNFNILGKVITEKNDPKKVKNVEQKLKKFLKIEDEKMLKKNPEITASGTKVLKQNQVIIVVPIECFSGIGALRNNNKTGLPSGASLLQIFVNKVKSVNMRHGCCLGLLFLVNEDYYQQLQLQLQQVIDLQNFANAQKVSLGSNFSQSQGQSNNQSLKYHIITFRNIWPSFDDQDKILISQSKAEIKFTKFDGDLVAFIQNSIEMKLLIQKYRFIHVTNINNMLAKIGDFTVFGLMEMKDELDIVAKVLKQKQDKVQMKDFWTADEKGFLEIKQTTNPKQNQKLQNYSLKYRKNQSFLNIEQYFIKTRIFTTQYGPLKRLLMSRIKRKLNPFNSLQRFQFYLKRDISDIFYNKFTSFISIEEEYGFSHVKSNISQFKGNLIKNGQLGYSRYCKKLLGLKLSDDEARQHEQLVQIDSGILHKGSDQILLILKKLENIKQIGFPIILYSDLFNVKQKQ